MAYDDHSVIELSNIQEFSLNKTVQEWFSSLEDGSLLAALKKHWKQYVPFVYSSHHESAKEERLAEKLLFRPMEILLCKDDPKEVFELLKNLDQPSQICGHVFKSGEPTYSCRECANDPTCVLCIQCFQKSVHKQHRYRMSTSGGGGYCDCGDPEAWKTEPFCDNHKKVEENSEQQNPIEALPDDLVNRASMLFMSTLSYAVELLTWEQRDSLPQDLQPDGELEDNYICVLFNDEVHTYEQVIQCLQRAIDCTQIVAANYATTVDREGRSSVKYGHFSDCERVKVIIEKHTSRANSKPLKTQVMHTTVVGHQNFALKLIQWLQTIISKSDGLRRLFCVLSMKPIDGEASLMEKMLLADTQLWKGARNCCHQLMMSGVLMDQDCKKKFAVLFTMLYQRLMEEFSHDDHDFDVSVTSLSVQIFTVPSLHYARLTKDFMLDDHYRAVSITSVSVQIFTVPTLARMLIAEENLLSVIIKSFMEPCREKIKDDGRLSFDKGSRSASPFKRAWYMLYDLRYALINKPAPGEWNDKLKQNFIKGLKSLLELLIAMQEMDAVTRQTGHHLEFEPEWENAFNLQLKLDDNIALILEWCASDKEVLIEAYRAALEALIHCRTKTVQRNSVEVAGCAAQVVKYDVSSQPVSVHLPVTRLIAGLHVYLEKFGLTFDSEEFNIFDKVDAAELIEPSLRCQVLIAQTQAGMWRRNGYSLLNQIFFYNNVKCRAQMFDKDIVMLQVGASIIDSNEFLILLINKFGLTGWVNPEYDELRGQEDSVRQTVMLAEEFLNMLIIILSERYTPGVGAVTADDVVRREIVHQLCIAPMAHSELTKALPEDYNHETGIEENVDGVADFIKPTGTGKGKYELKPAYYKDFNPCFYHYSRAEQSKAEEAQLKRKKLANNDQALPPPVPPPFTTLFSRIGNLLHCDVMIHIMRLVLTRTGAKWSKSWSEAQFEKVLHLVGLALHEQRRAISEDNNSFDFLQKSCKDPTKSNILSLLEGLIHNAKITHDTQNDLLAWIVKTFTEVLNLKNAQDSMDTVESPATFSAKKMQKEKKKKAELAAKRREKLMAQMSNMQRNFIKENAELFEETSSDIPRTSSEMDLSEQDYLSSPVCLGKHRLSAPQTGPQCLTCILCQEDQEITYSGRAMVLAAFIQQSTALSQSRGRGIKNGEKHDPLLMSSDLFVGAHTGSCGHAMHSDCWQRFFDAVLAKERRRPLRFRQKFSYNMEKNEYLCPLCECLSNTVIPVIPSLSSLICVPSAEKEADISFGDWLDGIQKTVQSSVQETSYKEFKSKHLSVDDTVKTEAEEVLKESEEETLAFIPNPIPQITKMMAESVAKNFKLLWEYVSDNTSGHVSEGMSEMLKKFSRDVYQVGLNVNPDDDNWRVPLMACNTCAYTIQVTEQCQREEEKPLFGSLPVRQVDCLNSLVKFAAISGHVTQPETVKLQCIRALTALIPNGGESRKSESLCILDFDMFHYLVLLVVNLPILYSGEQSVTLSSLPTGRLNDKYCLQICFLAHLVQILLVYEPSSSGSEAVLIHCGKQALFTDRIGPVTNAWYRSPQKSKIGNADSMDVEGDGDDSEGLKLSGILNKLKTKAGISSENCSSPWQLLQYVKKASLPFLRCAAIFFHYITGVTPPLSLLEDASELYHFEDLCKYLSLPTNVSSLLENQGMVLNDLVTSWCCSDTLKERLSASSQKVVRYPISITRLRELPGDYSELINQVSRFTCPKSEGDDSRAPTMCLVCGKILCSQSYCCQTELNNETVGAATEHTHTCGSGVGLFLRVRECQILLLAGKSKGCFVSPPYIDNYGETDQGLRRGNPLHLCKERYKQLLKLWYTHAIPETIAHTLESNTSLLDVEWQHL